MKIIIGRTDNIGDAIMALPLASLLKKQFPDCEILYLGRPAVQDIVNTCSDITGFINSDELETKPHQEAIGDLKKIKADIILHIRTSRHIAWLAKKAKIKQRVGRACRGYNWLHCNKLIFLSKKNKTEAQINLCFIKHLGIDTELSMDELVNHLRLHPKPEWAMKGKEFLKPDFFNLIVHPGSNIHGCEWPPSHFIELIHALPVDRFHILLTGSLAEAERFKSLIDACPQATNLMGKTSLETLTALIANADGLVASGTGPLHMAAALGIHTLGLYPLRAGIGPERWRPLGLKAQYLSYPTTQYCLKKDCFNGHCACMELLPVQQVQKAILSWVGPSPAKN